LKEKQQVLLAESVSRAFAGCAHAHCSKLKAPGNAGKAESSRTASAARADFSAKMAI